MRVFTLLVAGMFAGTVTAAPVPKGIKRTRPLAGTWELVTVNRGWVDVDFNPQVWVIAGESLVTRPDGDREGVRGATYDLILRPDVGTHAVDRITRRPDVGPDVTDACAFEVDGDTLRFCCPVHARAGRPADCSPGEDRSLAVFKRVTDEKKDK